MTRVRSQDGSALITSILVMTTMLILGIAAMAYVDGQSKASGSQRSSDAAFNLAEGVLETRVYLLSRGWPGSPASAHPAPCSSASPAPRCPDPAQITRSYVSPDWATGASWTSAIRDNGGSSSNFYSDSLTAGQPAWDANGDGRIWTRAQATARGRTRTIVALVQVRTVDLSLLFPRNVITAGWMRTTNSGYKVIVDTEGSAAQPAPVAVRCTTRDTACLGYDAQKGQIAPDTTQTAYSAGNALSAELLDTLRTRAIASGSYHASGCPSAPNGPIVFIENGNCSYNNSAGECCNSAAAPGILVIANGTLTLSGNTPYHGIVYLANQQNSTEAVLSINGTATIAGAVAVDGGGGVVAGSSAVNVTYADSAYNHLKGFGTAGIIQNTWREIPS